MKHPSFCPFPFESIAPKSWYKGKPERVVPCCNMKTDVDDPMGVAELAESGASLTEIFNSEQFDKLRSDLASGTKNSACDYCWRLEARTGHSPRLTALDAVEDIQPLVDAPVLSKIDANIDESCNLQCRMCAPSVSNALRKDYAAIVDANLPLPQYYNTKQSESQQDPRGTSVFFNLGDDYADEIVNISNQLTEIKFTGGEPTTSKTFWSIMDRIENPETITLNLTKNGTKFNNRFYDTVNRFGKRHFTISVDATRSTYEYMRYPFSWRKLEQNIIDLSERSDPQTTSIHICSVLTVYNMLNIRNLVDWIHQNNWFADVPITWKCIPDPHPFESVQDVRWASAELQQRCVVNLTAALDDATEHTEPALRKTIAYVQSWIDTPPNDELVQSKRAQLLQDTVTVDTVRKQTYETQLEEPIAVFLDSIK